MNNPYVPYKIAVALKEKGFVEPTIFAYDGVPMGCTCGKTPFEPLNYNSRKSGDYVSAPLYQQVVDWFRRTHRYHINVTFREFEGNRLEGINSVYFDIEIYRSDGGDVYKELKVMEWSDHYYVCLIKGIEEALKLI